MAVEATQPGHATALVTGATSGIGAAVARALADEGLKVCALGRNQQALSDLGRLANIEPLACDVADTAALEVALAGRAFDVLVNNAGVVSSRGSFAELSRDDIDAMLDVNVRAVMHVTRLCLPSMLEGNAGHIFFIGSSSGIYPFPGATVYGASKAAIHLFSDALRCELVGARVRITELAPGRVETRLYRDAIGIERAQRELYDDYEVLAPGDIAALLVAALKMPAHVDVSRMEVFPTLQAVGGGQLVKPDK
jgi:NADP-dependent 3-hydroxy acid dehydrogenase YdfG